jgi:hypothetical protein
MKFSVYDLSRDSRVSYSALKETVLDTRHCFQTRRGFDAIGDSHQCGQLKLGAYRLASRTAPTTCKAAARLAHCPCLSDSPATASHFHSAITDIGLNNSCIVITIGINFRIQGNSPNKASSICILCLSFVSEMRNHGPAGQRDSPQSRPTPR